MSFFFNGLRVVVHPDGHWRKRTWRDRLFSWPWRPWRKEDWVPSLIDAGSSYVTEDTLHITETGWRHLRMASKQSDEVRP